MNSGWKLIPQSHQDCQCWFIWACFPWDLGISSADCCCHISSLFRKHPQLHCGCWTTPEKSFPLIPPWFCPPPEMICLLLAIHKTELEGKENPVLRYVHWHRDLGKALQGETSPVVGCASTGSLGRTTAQLCPYEHPQSTTSF